MSAHRSGRTGNTRRRTGTGGPAIKRCRACQSEVLSAYKGAVTAVGQGVLEKVESNGDIIGRCRCGMTVTWIREIPSARGTVG